MKHKFNTRDLLELAASEVANQMGIDEGEAKVCGIVWSVNVGAGGYFTELDAITVEFELKPITEPP